MAFSSFLAKGCEKDLTPVVQFNRSLLPLYLFGDDDGHRSPFWLIHSNLFIHFSQIKAPSAVLVWIQLLDFACHFFIVLPLSSERKILTSLNTFGKTAQSLPKKHRDRLFDRSGDLDHQLSSCA